MKKIGRIFLVSLANVLQYKGEMFVWLLSAIFNSLSVLLLWIAGFASGSIHSVSLSFIQTYYVAILIISQGLSSHVEEGISSDIKTGNLSMHLLKPFPYFWLMFFEEIAWRLIGIVYSATVVIAIISLLGGMHFYPITALPFMIIIFMLTFVLSFLIKTCIALSTFFITESRPIFDLFEVITIVVGGYLMPLQFMPSVLRQIAFHLPFVYVVYYPVSVLTGTLPITQLPSIVLGQIAWILFFAVIFWFLWKRGLKTYTALGQ